MRLLASPLRVVPRKSRRIICASFSLIIHHLSYIMTWRAYTLFVHHRPGSTQSRRQKYSTFLRSSLRACSTHRRRPYSTRRARRRRRRPHAARAKRPSPTLPMVAVMRAVVVPHRRKGGDGRRRKRCARRMAVLKTAIVTRRCRTSRRQADGTRTGSRSFLWSVRCMIVT